jgi:hypothetical protein
MSNQKTVSQISLAAIALLAAALPCLAQTESGKTRNLNVQGTEIATLRKERLSVPRAELKTTPDVTAVSTSAARDRFNATIADATSANSAFTSKTFTASDWQKTQKLSSEYDSISSKSITFVPSRGQKLPD